MKRNPSRRRRVRRFFPLVLGLIFLAGVYSGSAAPQLPGLFRQRTASSIVQLMLEWELAPYLTDEPSQTEAPLIQIAPIPDAPDAQQASPPAQETPEDPGDAAEKTVTVNSNTLVGTVNINNNTLGISVDPDELTQRTPTQTISSREDGPQILIMHTHTTESYTMAGEDVYTETDTSRTDDPNYNMIRIGAEIKSVLEEMGFSVLHDTTLYDYPSYTDSYTRSLAGIKAWLEQYPSISVVLDVHRDALISKDGTVYKAVTQLDGESVAQIMLVCGTNDGGLDHPGWQDNLTIAAQIQMRLTGLEPTLARPINLRSQRFNQHLTPCSLLVEVGTSGNTLQEALRGARYFARCAGEVYSSLLA